jgi:RNA polymerase sigma-70 factor (ECF subfamily)
MSPTVEHAIRLKVRDLYADHLIWLRDWLQRRVGCLETAADLSQDVFARLLLREDVIRVRSPRAYIGSIARGLVIDHWRRRDVEQAWREIQATLPKEMQPSPEERYEIIEILTAVDRILTQLKPRMRTAFLLARLEGMTCPRIAEHLGVSLATVERDIASALRHCHQAAFGGGEGVRP